MPGNMPVGSGSEIPGGDGGQAPGGFGGFSDMMGQMTNYVDEIESATNLTVVLQLMGVGILLTLISSLFAVVFVLRYDPLKIMANRD